MVYIKTKEGASLWIALLATAIVAGTMTLLDAVWWVTLCVCGAVFVVVALVALFIIRKYVAYKLKPIYSIVLSRDVHTHEIFSELKDKHVENIGEELTAWADTNDKEIARLKETEQFRKQYLGNVAHELKTPISIAYAANDVLLNYSSTTNEKQKKYLDIVREQLNHLSGLVEQILTLSVENRSTFRLHLETIQVAELLTPLIEQFKLKTDKPIDITTEVPEHMTVTADRTHLYNMLSNLIGNAIKYSGEKTCRIILKGTVSSQEMTLSVTDEGIGISEANQKRVFDKFYRVPSGNLHDVKGFGLGLYYVSDMMSKHNGSVTVKSQLGKGSTFTLHFKN